MNNQQKMTKKLTSKKKEEAKARDESLDAKFSKMESEIKSDTVGQIKAIEHSIKMYFDTKIDLVFQQISNQMGNLIDAKYSEIHIRDYNSINNYPNSVTKEVVRLAVERVITTKYIDDNIKKRFGM